MAILIKTSEQIVLMRAANQVVARTHELLEKYIRPGVATQELDRIAEEYIHGQGAIPSFKGYQAGPTPTGFPGSICVSINEEVIHGIPGLKKLREGDIVSIDIGACKDGFHGDAARTHPVGKILPKYQKLIDVTQKCFFEAIEYARSGRHLHEICAMVQTVAESNGFSVVREYVGHGVGQQMHEDPQIPNFKQAGRGPRLSKGMTLAIEPMVNEGTYEINVLSDHWTVVTRDKKYSAHYENSILITDGAPEILSMV
ncbi:MAG: type I methionyl aminopeptidase [Clostridiales bacterium]|jgi:methionyl aminopeptidase|nr:type I methionyl aminopeptidase [Clostridiales bacterium]